jgi:hypothetical protein
MGEDLTPIILAAGALLIWLAWYANIVRVTRLASSHRDRLVLYLTPVGCLSVLALCLTGKEVASPQGWSGPVLRWYAAGALFLALAAWAVPWWGWGLSPRDDVAERRNRCAGWAIGGAMVGLTVAFAGVRGGTVAMNGEWPEGDALLRGMLSLIALFAFWGILERRADLSEAITVDRDGGAALRLAAFLPALGVLLGQSLPGLLAQAGWWKSLFLLGGPAGLLLGGVLIERWRGDGEPGGWPKGSDVFLALSYLGGAGLWTYLAR